MSQREVSNQRPLLCNSVRCVIRKISSAGSATAGKCENIWILINFYCPKAYHRSDQLARIGEVTETSNNVRKRTYYK